MSLILFRFVFIYIVVCYFSIQCFIEVSFISGMNFVVVDYNNPAVCQALTGFSDFKLIFSVFHNVSILGLSLTIILVIKQSFDYSDD